MELHEIPYTLKLSNYTTIIETPSRIFSWNDHNLDTKAFIAYQMIKRDLNEYTANERPEIERAKLEFFDTYTEDTFNRDMVFAVDIKSAYATILYLDGFICEKTYGYISTLDKKARLAAVGMLASRRDVFYYKGKELLSCDKIVNPYENYFWYCVKRTSEIMQQIAGQTKPLFYWVDGIYFETVDDKAKAKDILEAQGFKYSEKNCFMLQIECTRTKRTEVLNKISFYETKNLMQPYETASKKDLEYKVFSIPLRRNLRRELLEYLMNKQKN